MDLECPYCEYEYDYNGDAETDVIQEECPNCGKIFSVRIEYYPSYYCSELPCENGEDHKMKKSGNYNEDQELWYCKYEGCNHREWREKE